MTAESTVRLRLSIHQARLLADLDLGHLLYPPNLSLTVTRDELDLLVARVPRKGRSGYALRRKVIHALRLMDRRAA